MKTDIILAGVGGQGILSIAAVIGTAALKKNMFIKQAETHGMSQRGGAVVSHLRISDSPIFSDLIPEGEADLILAVEPLEALRYLPYLSGKGYIVTNSTPFINIPDYPPMEKIQELLLQQSHVIVVDADKIAEELGNKLASNMVMLGTAIRFLNHLDLQAIEKGIQELFFRKGDDVVNANIEAIYAGNKFAEQHLRL